MTQDIDTNGLVGRWLINGSLLDKVGSNNGTVGGAPEFKKTERGLAMSFDGTDDYIEMPSHYTDINYFISFWVKPSDTTTGQYIFDGKHVNKRSVILGYQDGYFNFYDGGYPTGTPSDTQIPASLGEWQHIVMGTDGTKVYGYKNGIKIIEQTGEWLATSATSFLIGEIGIMTDCYFEGFLSDIRIYNRVLTATEISNGYNATRLGHEYTETKSGFVYPKPTDSSNESGILLALNMISSGDTTEDISGYGNTATKEANGIFGENKNGHYFKSNDITSDGLVFPHNARYESLTEGTCIFVFEPNKFGDTQGLFTKNVGGSNKGDITGFLQNNNIIKFSIDTGSTTDEINSTATLSAEKPHLIEFNWSYDGSTNSTFNIYIDGVLDAGSPQVKAGDYSPFGSNTSCNIGISADGKMYDFRLYNKLLSASERANIQNKYARQLCTRENFIDAGADGIAGLPREWQAVSGVYKIDELSSADSVLPHLKKGTKYLEVSTAGVIGMQCDSAYGTVEFDIYKGADGNALDVNFIANKIAQRSGGNTFNDGYTFNISTGELVRLYKFADGGSVSELFKTGDSYIAIQTWYRIRITRSFAGVMTTYIKGGGFGDVWTQVVETFGDNPVTDTTYTTSGYFAFDGDALDRIANIKFYKGIAIS